jgi:hypothetical protein
LSEAEVESKFIELAVPVIGDVQAVELLAALWRIDSMATTGLQLATLKAVGS